MSEQVTVEHGGSLEDAIRQELWADPKTLKYNSHVSLDAMITVAAELIYRCANDHGAMLAALLNQFVERLHTEIASMDHDPSFHDPDDDC